MSASPYAPPRAVVVDAPATGSEAELTRREHIRHEVQLKSVGALYYLGGALMLFGAISILFTLLAAGSRPGTTHAPRMDALFVGIVVLYFVLGTGALFLGWGFRRLKPWVRIPGGILAALGLIGFPVGTLINGWILYLMFGKKGQVVLGPDYQAVIEATPHIRYQRSVGDWIALGIVVVLLLGVVFLLVASRLR